LYVDSMETKRALVAVIGDGTAHNQAPSCQLAEAVGEHLIDAGFRLVTGGLGGVMEAACRGARRSRAYRSGDIVGILPGHDPQAANPFVDVAVATGLGHGRNLLTAHADAVVAIGGGAGTLSEMAMAWIHQRLLIAFRIDGWSGRLAGTRIDDRPRFAATISDDQVFGVNTAEEALAVLRARLPVYLAALRPGRL
jgi:uncharacterized protein (TIGR00725 family)